MEKVIDGGCINSDFELNVKKKTIRFKAGAELSSSVNKMDVDFGIACMDRKIPFLWIWKCRCS